MKIEVGKYYRTRDGRKVGPMKYWDGEHIRASGHDEEIDGMLWEIGGGRNYEGEFPALDLIAEWTEPPCAPEKPKTWGQMTDAEKGEIALAYVEKRPIEVHTCGMWVDENGSFPGNRAYRIKPEPVRETVACWWGSWGFTLGNQSCRDTHRITFTTTDGKPDLDSIKMEEV